MAISGGGMARGKDYYITSVLVYRRVHIKMS